MLYQAMSLMVKPVRTLDAHPVWHCISGIPSFDLANYAVEVALTIARGREALH